jgi:hypothetical protein
MWDSCGVFRLDTDGRVLPLRRHWLAFHGGGTGRRFGAKLKLRRTRDGAYLLERDHRIVWRSTGRYPNDYTGVAFGPGLFAFGSYTKRGIYLTDLRGPERLVVRGRGRFPLDFTRTGHLLVVAQRKILVLARDGHLLRRLTYKRGYGFDDKTDALYLVTPRGMLVEARDTRVRRLRPAPRITASPIPLAPRLLGWFGTHRLVVTDRTGAEVASARWSAKLGTNDFGVSASADGELFAFRLSSRPDNASPGVATVFLLRRGEDRGRVILEHREGPMTCGIPGGFSWHNHDLLYDFGDGRIEIVEPESSEKAGLTRLARSLPRRAPSEPVGVAWESSFHP